VSFSHVRANADDEGRDVARIRGRHLGQAPIAAGRLLPVGAEVGLTVGREHDELRSNLGERGELARREGDALSSRRVGQSIERLEVGREIGEHAGARGHQRCRIAALVEDGTSVPARPARVEDDAETHLIF
jgi:hypothetical protein